MPAEHAAGGRHLFIASTPLIALEAAAMARRQPGQRQLVLCADFDLAGRLRELLQAWPDNPFEAITLLPGRFDEHRRGAGARERGLRALWQRVRIKRDLRRETLAALAHIDGAFKPDRVWIGNDRKVETQYALHLASTRTGERAGIYLDDGLHTYLGRMRERPLARWQDWAVKRLSYGRWWHRSSQSGTSPWIAEAWMAFPSLAVDKDASRARQPLQAAWFGGRPLLRLAVLASRDFAVDRSALRRCGSVLVLPHSNLLRAHPELGEALRAFIASEHERGRAVAVKYHPREHDADPARLEGPGVLALPMLLPMELLLPLLPANALLAGEASTALLAAHWLRPDLRVVDLGLSSGAYVERARAFLAAHGIADLGGDLAALAGTGTPSTQSS